MFGGTVTLCVGEWILGMFVHAIKGDSDAFFQTVCDNAICVGFHVIHLYNVGARGRTRTCMALPPEDFKSSVYTIPPHGLNYLLSIIILEIARMSIRMLC